MRRSRSLAVFLVAVPAVALPFAARVAAQERPIEEIVVTSEFRPQAVEDTASSVTVVNVVEDRGVLLNHLEDVLARIPNVNVAGGSSRARFYQIRGIGERGQFEEPLNASVGLLIDGVDFSGIGTGALLHDVRQVEVLRGPQGTLYGANALAGLVQLRSMDPTDEFTAGVSVDAGNYDARGLDLTVSGPLSSTLGARVAVHGYRDDGFMRNAYLDRDDTNDHDEVGVRTKLRWTPTDSGVLSLIVGYADVDNGYDAFSLDNTRTTLSDEPGQDSQQSYYGSVTADWALSDAVLLNAALGLAGSETDYGYDEDWTYEGFDANGYASTDRYLRDHETASADVRLLSGPSGRIFGGTTDWVAGVYALRQQVDLTREYTFLESDFESEFRMHRMAAYGELTVPMGERNRVVLGMRLERHDADYEDSAGVETDPADDLWGGRLVFERDFGVTVLGYLSATRGYKAGGFNTSGTLEPAQREFDPETLWNFEAGLKGAWIDGRIEGALALFRMQREDVQVETSIDIQRPDGSTEFISLTDNAAKGVNYGAELELRLAVTERLDLEGSLGLLKTRFADFVNTSGEDLDGEPQAHAPAYQFHLAAEYRPAPRWFARLEVQGRDAFYYSDGRRFDATGAELDDVRSSAYELVNASLGYRAPSWELRAWARNLADEDYFVRGYFFGNDPRDFYTERGFFQYGEPRRYGVTLKLEI